MRISDWSSDVCSSDLADRHHFIGVDPGVGLLAEEILHDRADLGHPRHAADEHDLVDRIGLEAGILERLLARIERALDEILDQLLEIGRSEEHTSELQSLMRNSYAVFCSKTKKP